MLAAADPAQPYGAPRRRCAGAGRPGLPVQFRSAARPALFVERGGRSLAAAARARGRVGARARGARETQGRRPQAAGRGALRRRAGGGAALEAGFLAGPRRAVLRAYAHCPRRPSYALLQMQDRPPGGMPDGTLEIQRPAAGTRSSCASHLVQLHIRRRPARAGDAGRGEGIVGALARIDGWQQERNLESVSASTRRPLTRSPRSGGPVAPGWDPRPRQRSHGPGF